MLSLPVIARVPLQPPDAVQLVAFAADHEIVAAPPLVTDTGFADNDSVGAGEAVTLTTTFLVTVPPLPVQASVNVLLAVSAPVETLVPEVGLPPDQAPEAVHELALVADQLRFDAPPLATDTGLALNDSVGAGAAATVTVTDLVLLPPVPVQVSE